MPQALHRAPALSHSVKEFWGQRWNRTVHVWLFERIYRPLARRRLRRTGITAAFVFSALIHAHLVVVSLDWTMTAWMLGYFLLQGVLMLMEEGLGGLPAWRHVARLWTIVVMAATSPLFVEPFLRIIDGIAI